ncbi:MAG: ATP-binding cassette domain-containing protein [Betaproteobacteria bacterium]|nr:ATP-binding cassette domain-containing protein [Betaproteobacteria bacterium]MBV9362248.1 ATP-binding cassette domain-containing protein [Betaproteobacteria bacterium]
MIRFSQVTLARGAKVLLEGTDLTLHQGERVGLIGANGSGKSSLFSLLQGELHADKGDVEFPAHWRIAHVAQETPALDRPATEYAIDGDTALRELEAKLAVAEAEDDGALMGELHAALADADAYTARSRAETLLLGLGFGKEELEQPVASFSGGWRMRLNLAQALMCRSDLLLLDEPTNHLDLDAIVWLEDWLKRYPGTLIIVSHDRDFLDGVVETVVHIDSRKLRRYSGNYSAFEEQRAQGLVLQQAQYEKQQRERAHLQSFIDRFRAKATKAKQAQSRMKMLARMEDLAPVHAAAPFSFEFRDPERSPDPLLVLEQVAAGYAERKVLEGVMLTLRANERIGLLGVNGAGKSTLIKTIAGVLPPLGGSAVVNKGLVVGYFAQHQVEMLRDDQSPLWHLSRLSDGSSSKPREQELRDYLGSFNFPGDMATGPVEHFSGGEKARLALALIVWQRPNLLLLDEPTNHLDLETREALTVALAQFEGTLVLVSHDRHLLRASTEQLVIVRGGRVSAFEGDLDDYRASLLNRVAPRPKPGPAAKPSPRKAGAKKNLQSRIQRLEEQMKRLGVEIAAVEARLVDPATYGDGEAYKGLAADQAYLRRELDQLETEWLARQAELEN